LYLSNTSRKNFLGSREAGSPPPGMTPADRLAFWMQVHGVEARLYMACHPAILGHRGRRLATNMVTSLVMV
jgi:hypothetical protein